MEKQTALSEVALTATQLKILSLMKNNPLKKYGRVCYVGDNKFNANSVKPLIKKGVIQFHVHDEANGWDYYELADKSQYLNQLKKP